MPKRPWRSRLELWLPEVEGAAAAARRAEAGADPLATLPTEGMPSLLAALLLVPVLRGDDDDAELLPPGLLPVRRRRRFGVRFLAGRSVASSLVDGDGGAATAVAVSVAAALRFRLGVPAPAPVSAAVRTIVPLTLFRVGSWKMTAEEEMPAKIEK